MNLKHFVVSILLSAMVFTSSSIVVFAEDGSGATPEPDTAAVEEVVETVDESASVSEVSPEEVEYYRNIIANQYALQSELMESNASLTRDLRSVVALLFILVCIDVMRIVKAWTVTVRGGEYRV